MNVLSLFDGMSCGQIALKELGVKVGKYYASEIDKFAIQQTQHNFPNTIQVGDVTKVIVKDLDKIDLLIGGSPCQGFSFAGKQLAFDDPRSVLFFEFVRIWNEVKSINPNALFLLENVNMKKNELRIISEYMGVFPVNINSNLVSAQNRNRWYWTNIKTKDVGLFAENWVDIPQPEDRGILLKDILQPESEVDEKYYLSTKAINSIIKNPNNLQKSNINPDKSNPLQTPGYSAGVYKGMSAVCVAMRGRNPDNPSDRTTGSPTEQRLEAKTDGKTNCLTSVAKDNLVACLTPKRTEYGKAIRKEYEAGEIQAQRKEVTQLEPREDGKTNTITTVQKDNLIVTKNYIQWDTSGKGYKSQQDRAFFEDGKYGALASSRAGDKNGVLTSDFKLRRLTPTECARLQTIPDWYEWIVSDTQIYRMLGNGWTVDVITHILSFYEKD